MHNSNDKGFTLVELAIVMIIIGLLIGGVLKGQTLIANAKTTAAISEMKSFQTAMLSFKDAYGTLPGDIANADTRLSGCDATNTNNCVPGNGDAIIGNVTTNIQGFNTTVNAETVQFWKHLALANLITGVDPTAGVAAADLAWGQSMPAAALRGGYNIIYNNDQWGNAEYGHVIRMQNGTQTVNPNPGEAPASPLQAFQIDIKLDDGKPGEGLITSDDSVGGASDCEGNSYGSVSGYLTDRKDCVIIFAFE